VTVYEPRDQRQHPVLIVLDGTSDLGEVPASRGGQARPEFDPWIQYLVNELGWAVLEPDLRGSTGYGKTFRSLDAGSLREDSVKDIGALLVWLGAQSEFDAKHVVVFGSGHGGYLALAALINFGDRLSGGVDVGGITDLVDYLGRAPADLQLQDRLNFGDERDPDNRGFLRRISPLNGADRISKPLLVAHGRNDPLVPADQSQQLVNRLRARGVRTWYVLAENEGDRLRRKSDRDAFLLTLAQFLNSVR
jgi:dipeptidyl aminopeptidase/acylaminoacyl peptidase